VHFAASKWVYAKSSCLQAGLANRLWRWDDKSGVDYGNENSNGYEDPGDKDSLGCD